MKTLVTHEGVSRVIEHDSVKDLRSKIRTFFGLLQDECKLEIYDEEWSCWTWLEDKDKITISRPRVRTLSSVVILDSNHNSMVRKDTVPVGPFDDSQLRPALRAKLRSNEKQPLTRTEWSELTGVIVNHEKLTNG
ncbi:hypothetical protein FJT64_021962 [Amphibalanus amphitrite]|uniref:Uncharacterized protein n=1 Tax=Amphibalanus amphitrite TaxID=1232801 RepID=A0A6A4WW20_AMPAM|nr:hypothetical protein FJT64_021962 [Amphibalanus amphitrite]KAF0306558.1 hypothetical protein FJT64_021962 [Amphibalanus amphitrite]